MRMRRKRAGVAEIIRTTCWGNKKHGEHGKHVTWNLVLAGKRGTQKVKLK